MKKMTAIILVIIALLIGGFAGMNISAHFFGRITANLIQSSAMLDITDAYSALSLLRADRTGQAAALLETQLDGGLASLAINDKIIDRQSLWTNRTLMLVKEYRLAHPYKMAVPAVNEFLRNVKTAQRTEPSGPCDGVSATRDP